MFKLKMQLTSNDLHIQFKTSPLKGITANLPAFPKHASTKNRSLFETSFAVRGPTLWNLLPKDTRSQTKLDAFKISLSHFLATLPDQPPVSGYTTTNDNSISSLMNSGGHLYGRRPM